MAKRQHKRVVGLRLNREFLDDIIRDHDNGEYADVDVGVEELCDWYYIMKDAHDPALCVIAYGKLEKVSPGRVRTTMLHRPPEREKMYHIVPLDYEVWRKTFENLRLVQAEMWAILGAFGKHFESAAEFGVFEIK